MIRIKRIYEPFDKTDGYRVLIDRLWPRGIKREEANIDIWLKDIAPSTILRKWFNHDPEKWESFRKKYQQELKGQTAVKEMKQILKEHPVVTLLYSAKNENYNQAIALASYLKGK